MITIDEVRKMLEQIGYEATEELLYETFNILCMFASGKKNHGQDIVALCLEGPPGSGKTEFAKTYTKLTTNFLKENVEMVDYQCDATTGKAELFEDINISAAIRNDDKNVNIPGKLIDAIKKVNEGQKVILFIDEYDKAREETDAFFLQLLQSGKINSTQHGDLEIKEEYKSNIHVILCKNNMREDLSGPLSRRIRIIRLDYMKPEVFYKVARRTFIDQAEDKVNEGLINFVALIYEHAYNARDIYNRLPSCSEMLIAIEDADRLIKRAQAPQYIIYNIIIKNMFKSLDDIKTFESSLDTLKTQNDSTLAALVMAMKVTEPKEEVDLNQLIAETIFVDESEKLKAKIEEMEQLIAEYKTKFATLEQQRKEAIEEEISKISLEKGKLVATTQIPNIIKIFEDESAHIKRGENILELSTSDWTDVACVTIPALSHHVFGEKLVEHASKLDIIIYENGILLQKNAEQLLMVINDLDDDNQPRYRIMSNQPIIPSTYLVDIRNFINFAMEVYESQTKTATQLTNNVIGIDIGSYSINALAYNDTPLSFEKIKDNVYNVDLSGNTDDLSSFDSLISTLSCNDLDKALKEAKDIMSGKKRVLKNE